MSMSTHVDGFKPADEQWEKMKAVYNACDLAGIDIPVEVHDYFCGENPNTMSGIIVEIEKTDAVKQWSDEGRQGFEVDLSKLPKDVKVIRFFNDW